MPSKPKRKYRIHYLGYVLEGTGTSSHNAIVKALRLLLQQNKIKQRPKLIHGLFKGVKIEAL
jgi:hypothetical protein